MREPVKQSDSARRPLFDDAELDAANIPPDLTPRQWAAANRRLPPGGPAGDHWQNEHSPALAVLMDIAVRETVLEIWIKKCVQAGVSTMAQNIVGRYADLDPCTCLVVLSTKELGDRAISRDWRPMFTLCEPLKAKRTGRKADNKKLLIKLVNSFELHLAYSGSISSLAQLSAKLLVLDETDKWEGFDGQEADPIDLARMRQTKWLDKGAKLIGLSTPTTSEGNIAKEVDACSIKIEYAVPCPHCQRYQVLHQNALRWPAANPGEMPNEHSERVQAERSAWFDCVWCKDASGQPVRIEEKYKRSMVNAGRWQTPSESWCVYYDGREEGHQPAGVKIGAKYPAFYDFDIGWSKIASEAIEAGRNPAKLLKVTTQRYAEEFKFQEIAQAANLFSNLCRADPETGFVPFPANKLQPWVMRLLMTVDTQKNGFWWVLRGWGAGMRSHRVAHGQAVSFDQIEEICRIRWPFVGVDRPSLGIWRVGIDSGGGIQGKNKQGEGDVVAITRRVYEWCEKDPTFRLALKGDHNKIPQLVRTIRGAHVSKDEALEPFERTLNLMDSMAIRDLLASYIVGKVPLINTATGEVVEVDQWSLNDIDDFTYNQHMSAVKKLRKMRGGKAIVEWDAEDGARHDYHDCEAYQIALAEGLRHAIGLSSIEELAEQERAAQVARATVKKPVGIPLPSGRPWGQR